jgi:hypothetical protein
MGTYQPRTVIPESWAQIGACPICNSRGLTVKHTTGQPDQMCCPQCQASFELEVDGPNIRLMVLPTSFAAFLQPAWQTWMSVFEINRQIKSGMDLHLHDESGEPSNLVDSGKVTPANLSTSLSTSAPNLFDEFTPFDPLSQEDVTNRAIGLANLGNSPKEIRATLERFNATPDQIRSALTAIDSHKKTRKSNTPRTIFFVILGVLVCLGISALLLPLLNLPGVIREVSPFWNALQRSLSQDDIYGGVTGATPPTQSPTAIPGTFSPDDQQYFDSVWSVSQKQNWWEKYTYLDKLFPPLVLMDVHNEVLSRYLQVAILQASQEENTALVGELCATSRAQSANLCAGLDDNYFVISTKFLKAQNDMNGWWVAGPCERFREYYKQKQVPFPYADGTCAYP